MFCVRKLLEEIGENCVHARTPPKRRKDKTTTPQISTKTGSLKKRYIVRTVILVKDFAFRNHFFPESVQFCICKAVHTPKHLPHVIDNLAHQERLALRDDIFSSEYGMSISPKEEFLDKASAKQMRDLYYAPCLEGWTDPYLASLAEKTHLKVEVFDE